MRIIPSLLLSERGCVKTLEYSDPIYLGDPSQIVSLLVEKDATEICLIDIFSSRLHSQKKKLLKKIASRKKH